MSQKYSGQQISVGPVYVDPITTLIPTEQIPPIAAIILEASSASSGVTEMPLYHGMLQIDPDIDYPSIPTASGILLSAYAASVRSDAGGGPGNEWTATLYVRPYGESFSPVATFQLNT